MENHEKSSISLLLSHLTHFFVVGKFNLGFELPNIQINHKSLRRFWKENIFLLNE